MDDDEVQEIVQEDRLVRGGEQCSELSFAHLVQISNVEMKRIFIDSVQKFVINNSEIVVRLSIIISLIVMRCVQEKY